MGVSSYLEFVTVLFAWVMYDKLWSVLNDTGIVYLPFVVIILKNVIESRKGGDDEGSAAVQSLKKCETDVIVALAVMFFAAVPLTEVRLGEMTYLRPRLDCGVAERIDDGAEEQEIAGDATGTSYDVVLASLGGEVGKVPLWWGFVHVVSKAVVAAGVAAVPCSSDVAGVSAEIASQVPGDSGLLGELEDFRSDCHRRTLSCMQQGGCTANSATPLALETKDYLGSAFFLTEPGYYDRFQSSKDRRPAWSVSPPRDTGRAGAHPWCTEWWSDPALGLRARLLLAIDADLRDRLIYDDRAVWKEQHPALTEADREDLLLRRFLEVRTGRQSLSYDVTPGEAYDAAGGGIRGLFNAGWDMVDNLATSGAAALGVVLNMPGHAAAGVVVRDGMPMFLALLLMVFVVVLPFLMVFSRYDPATLLTLTIVFFGLQFVYVLWGVAFWVDNHLYMALAPEGTMHAGDGPVQSMMLVWVQRLLYVVFPVVWVASLGWVGIQAKDAFSGAVSGPSGQLEGVAQKGGDAAVGAVRGAVGGPRAGRG